MRPTPILTPSDLKRILPRLRVTSTGCMVWTGATNPVGLPLVTIKNENYVVTRLLYARAHGRTSVDNKKLVRTCGTPLCANPNHHELTQWRKLADDEVRVIRSSRLTTRELGTMFGVSHELIKRVLRNHTYADVSGPDALPRKVGRQKGTKHGQYRKVLRPA